ncbi:MAG: hypothetical protein R2831_01675 [Chitinophagaceae bacterium]
MGAGTTTTTSTTTLSSVLKDYATSVGLVGSGVAAAGAIPEPGSPALVAAGAGMLIGAGIVYAGASVLSAMGY